MFFFEYIEGHMQQKLAICEQNMKMTSNVNKGKLYP